MSYPGQQQPPGSSGMQVPGMQPVGGGLRMPGPGNMQGPNPGMPGPMPPGGMQLGQLGGMQSHGPGGLSAPGGQNMMPGGPMPQGGPGPTGMPPMPQGAPGAGPGPGMPPHMGNGMIMMQGRGATNGVPHPGGQMAMPPQMGGGMPVMNPPQIGPPGSQPVLVSCSIMLITSFVVHLVSLLIEQVYRQNMHNIHKNNMPVSATSPPSDPPFNTGGPPGPPFNQPNSRVGGNPIGGQPQNRMLPPPSPAPGKDGSLKDGKPTEGSPRNQQTPNPNNPSTPAPNQQNPSLNQGTPVGGARAAPSPVPAVMGSLNSMGGPGGMNPPANMNLGMMGMNPQTSMSASVGPGSNNAGLGGGVGGPGIGGPGMHLLAGMSPMAGMTAGTGHGININLGGMNPSGVGGVAGANGADVNASVMGSMSDLNTMFSQDLMAAALDDIDTTIFKPDGNVDFDRDFNEWFGHPDDPLDLK